MDNYLSFLVSVLHQYEFEGIKYNDLLECAVSIPSNLLPPDSDKYYNEPKVREAIYKHVPLFAKVGPIVKVEPIFTVIRVEKPKENETN